MYKIIPKSKHQGTNLKYRTVGRVGADSLFTVLPKQLAQKLKIEQGNLLKIYQDSGRIIIEKVEE